jgi:hypothetical protein
MARDYGFTADGRRFFAVKRRVREMLPSWEGKGNPMLWFSWEQKGSERDYLACGVKTLYEAQRPIDKICDITG